MLASCIFAVIAILLVGESQSVPILGANPNQLLDGVTNTGGGIVPTGGSLEAPGLLRGVLEDVLGKREPTASPATVTDSQNPTQGLPDVGSTLHQTGSSVVSPLSSQSLPALGTPSLPVVGKPSLLAVGSPSLPAVETSSLPAIDTPSLPVVGKPSLPAVGTPSVPVIGSSKAPLVGTNLQYVSSSLPLGAVPSVPKTLSSVTVAI